MAISELIGLLELTRNLANRKSQLNKEFFENFIEPVWDAFARVHNDYKKSLEEYENLLADDKTEISVLMNKIEKDSVLTGESRAELYALLDSLPSAFGVVDQESMSSFANGIVRYITFRLYETTDQLDLYIRTTGRIVGPSLGWEGQRIRTTLWVYLSRRGDGTNREQAKEMIRRLMQELQRMYADISRSYQRLRLKMLR